MKLLFVTQKLHGQDAFTILWVNAFQKIGYRVTVLCLEWKPDDISAVLGNQQIAFAVCSMGKEKGIGKFGQIRRFLRTITRLQYDRVFIHMNPVWGLIGAPVWIARRTPVYLWYTHYKMQAGLWLLGIYGKRLFCATPQSLPHYEGSPKKVVVGHGIDLSFWPKRNNIAPDPKKLLVVHRLSRSKRLEITIRALTLLPGYSIDIYGIEAEPHYVAELKQLVTDLKLSDRVVFHGSIPASELASVYAKYRLIINMASETIDKTMLEAMICGCYPVTTRGNAEAIGLQVTSREPLVGSQKPEVRDPKPEARDQRPVEYAPTEDTPEAVAAFVQKYAEKAPLDADAMYAIVRERHSLASLMVKMDAYIRPGQ